MLKCKHCGEESPMDAKFCIGCAKPVEVSAYSGKTVDLGRLRQGIQPNTNPSGAPYYSAFVDYSNGVQSPVFRTTITGAIAFPFTDFSKTAQEQGDYFIYRADLRVILKHPNTYVKKTDEGYDIYFYGRKIVFMD